MTADPFRLDVGPEWLFFRFTKGASSPAGSARLADSVWASAEPHQIFQIVAELDGDVVLTSYLIGQLVLLHKRCHLAGGMLRICGFSNDMYQVLEIMQLHERFPNYPTREAAVMGHRPS